MGQKNNKKKAAGKSTAKVLYRGNVGRSAEILATWTAPLKLKKEQNERLKSLALVVVGVLGLSKLMDEA